MILLAWLVNRTERSFVILKRGLGGIAVALAIGAVVAAQRKHVVYADLPSGRTAFTDPSVQEEYVWIKEHTRPGQPFWGLATLYFPFQLQHSAPLDQLCSCDYTRPEDVAALVKALQETQVPTIIIPSQRKYPMTENTPGNHLQPFVAYLNANYRLTKVFATGDEVWQLANPVGSLRSALTAAPAFAKTAPAGRRMDCYSHPLRVRTQGRHWQLC
jgi:hypothetical protein